MRHKKHSHHSGLSPLFQLFSRSFFSLQDHLEDFRTYIITRAFLQRMMYREKPQFFKRYVVTLSIFGLALYLRYILQLYFGGDILFIKNISVVLFLFTVIIAAWYGGMGTGLFATLLSLITITIFTTKPELITPVTQPKDQLRLLFFLILGILISLLYEAVQETSRWQSIILESISDTFITFDRNMRFIYINKKAEEVFHLQRRHVLGKRFRDVYPNAHKLVFYKHCLEAAKKQKKIQFELYMESERRWYSILLYPSVDGISAYLQDVTRRKRIETKLRERQLQFQRLFNANIIGIFTADAEGNVFQANDLFLTMIGYSYADLRNGRINWKKITPDAYQIISDKTNAEVLRKGMSPPFQKEYIRKDGERIDVLMGKVLLNKATGSIMALTLDITEQKK